MGGQRMADGPGRTVTRALILSAGQGRRLLPLTETVPKCAIHVGGRTFLDWQLDALAQCEIRHVTVVVGFGREHVERLLVERAAPPHTRPIFNPFFPVSDNLVSCWIARTEMTGDFVLLNGDTLFEPDTLGRLLTVPPAPVRVAVDHKDGYDADDMKVTLDGDGRLLKVGKHLSPEATDGESIGMMLFRGEGPALFRGALERALERPEGLKAWYLSVIDDLAARGFVQTTSISGYRWAEVDAPADLTSAEEVVAGLGRQPASFALAR